MADTRENGEKLCANLDKSAASFMPPNCSTRVPDMPRNFYLVKNHNIVHNSTTTEAREKINTDLDSLEFLY